MNIFLYAPVLAVFILAAWIDARKRIIPNTLSLLLLIIGTINCIAENHPLYVPIIHGGITLAFYLSIALLGDAYLRRKSMDGCALGGGDIKFLSAFAYVVGAYAALVVACIAFMLALLYKRFTQGRATGAVSSVPLAPFFLAAFLISVFRALFYTTTGG